MQIEEIENRISQLHESELNRLAAGDDILGLNLGSKTVAPARKTWGENLAFVLSWVVLLFGVLEFFCG